ncbi:MAG TPA: tetraacyldisaccharide 4'-kinase [Kiritimatiellia bacterium]|nr:tetraacyldisaccharide 4'-kinase [Kiritimatiellia bacterium]HMO99602.1 tetraacyldisaccharide 4'-kinase [Kiritimatiellia bacterium]HMP97234.1 tetraacyldisaccharide 4'-kinase [Kiritimatiellia bacterium]
MRETLERLEAYILSIIENRQQGKRHIPVRIFLYALSLIFAVLVQTRLWLYRRGLWRPHTLGCQVISIGNLTVGGTGKTPIVEIFARTLQKSGRKVAILSRGYKKDELPWVERVVNKLTFRESKTPPRVVSDGERLLLDSSLAGDEPYMLASNLKDVVVVVDKDRVKAGRWAINKFGCDTLILDDGFQYLTLKHRLDIVLVDRTNPFGNWRMLPRGILREPVRNIKRAGFIFITKSNGDGAGDIRKTLRQYNTEAEIVECRHCARYLKNVYSDDLKPLEFLHDLKIAAISGIAQPKGFEDELIRLGAKVMYHKRYADHHRYTQQEVLDCINKGIQRGADVVVTTEKDAVRFPWIERRDIPVYYLRVEIEMLSGEEKFHEWINRICFR